MCVCEREIGAYKMLMRDLSESELLQYLTRDEKISCREQDGRWMVLSQDRRR